ncbi:MAG: bifunctional UDP-N-acetylglucosamine diphosphorylase/glucosamine-1-phosphate N-acetyltransferase GlmU [Planctomycetota bacterium]|jgi:bifunctional UDP-N-acetylglucosamine pyrophosphorylase/glucosamine-1-phosphate N-acetyltransferase
MSEKLAIILAAGQSTRMNTKMPKVLHEVCGRPMLEWVLEACRAAGVNKHVVVVGYGKEQIIERFAGDGDVEFVEQKERKGTGHAVMVCREHLEGFGGETIILCGDAPLIRTETLKVLIEKHAAEKSAVTLATAVATDPSGYGRIVRDSYGNIEGIVEHNDCNEKQLAIDEINPGYFCFQTPRLLEALDKIKPNNVKNEYYLTDALHILLADGHKATAVTAVAEEDAMGVNNRKQLSVVGKIMQGRVQEKLMADGVTIVDPPNTWIDARAKVGQDAVIEPFTCIAGAVKIGANTRIGPFAYLHEGASVSDGSTVGVFKELK